MAQKTTDHERIKQWAEQRGGMPGAGEEGLHIDFDEHGDAVAWDEFFQKFEQDGLAMEFEERNNRGQMSKYCRFIDRAAA